MIDLNICAALSNAFGPSGFEEAVADVLEPMLNGCVLRRDSLQNLYAALPQNQGGRPLVMLDAHMDEVGFLVQSVTANGLRTSSACATGAASWCARSPLQSRRIS